MNDEEKCGQIVKKYYHEFLNRKPDKKGFEHYYWLLYNRTFDEQMLISDIKRSPEYNARTSVRNEFKKILSADKQYINFI